MALNSVLFISFPGAKVEQFAVIRQNCPTFLSAWMSWELNADLSEDVLPIVRGILKIAEFVQARHLMILLSSCPACQSRFATSVIFKMNRQV